MAALIDLIKIYDDKLDQVSCQTLINLFESQSSGSSEYNLTDNKDISDEIKSIHNNILKIVVNTRNEYYEYCYGKVFPEMNSFEKFSIIKYDQNNEVENNVELDVKTYSDARRFLGFKFYLNNNSGGQTKFLDLTIQPKLGKLVVYPPFWMFPHKELTPVDSPKYILQTYLHYK
jgi:hypothetical protein